MVRGSGKTKEMPLSSSEKENLLDQKRELQYTLKETQQYGKGTSAEQIDQTKIQRQITQIDQTIQDREPPKLKGSQKDELAEEAKRIEEELREGMPTRDEMSFPAKNPGAVRKHMNWSAKNVQRIERYRYIQRVINPDAPRSVENLRREK
jgi:hypothetical protein